MATFRVCNGKHAVCSLSQVFRTLGRRGAPTDAFDALWVDLRLPPAVGNCTPTSVKCFRTTFSISASLITCVCCVFPKISLIRPLPPTVRQFCTLSPLEQTWAKEIYNFLLGSGVQGYQELWQEHLKGYHHDHNYLKWQNSSRCAPETETNAAPI